MHHYTTPKHSQPSQSSRLSAHANEASHLAANQFRYGEIEHELHPLDSQGQPRNHEAEAETNTLRETLSTVKANRPPVVGLLAAQRDSKCHSVSQASIAEHNVTVRQDDEDRVALLGNFETLTPSPQPSLSMHGSKPLADHLTRARPVSTPHGFQPQGKTSPSYRLWLWEIMASVFSLACIASVIGVLLYEQGKPLDQWGLGQSYLSPTVLVSFLGTIGKSACMLAITEVISQLKWLHFHKQPQKLRDLQIFDDASRGPWGAAQLIILQHRRALLATCASLITISALLVDPFIQSVFQFPIRLTPVQGVNPGIATSQVYDPAYLLWRNGQCYGAGMVDATMQAAVLSPIWNVTRAPSLACNFERCEWPTITTLGVCSSCVELTDTVKSVCTANRIPYHAVDCNYTVSKSTSVFNAVFGLTGGAAERVKYSTVWNSVAESAYRDLLRSAFWNGVFTEARPAILSNFTFIQFDPLSFTDFYSYSESGGEGTITSHPPVKQAMQCTMQLCARTFKQPYYANFSASLPAESGAPLITSIKGTTDDDSWGSGSVYIGLEPGTPVDPSMNTTFQINFCQYQDIGDYLRDLFTTAMDTTGIIASTTDTTTGGIPFDQRTTPNVGLALSRTQDIPALMQQIADSMTEEIRTSANSSIVDGVAMNSMTFIAIRWVWLALPISLVLMSLLLLILVMINNKALGIPVWKSSSLTLLFYEVHGWVRNELVIENPEDIVSLAKGMNARAENAKGRLFFSKA